MFADKLSFVFIYGNLKSANEFTILYYSQILRVKGSINTQKLVKCKCYSQATHSMYPLDIHLMNCLNSTKIISEIYLRRSDTMKVSFRCAPH